MFPIFTSFQFAPILSSHSFADVGFLHLLNNLTEELPEDLISGDLGLATANDSAPGNSAAATNNTDSTSNNLLNNTNSPAPQQVATPQQQQQQQACNSSTPPNSVLGGPNINQHQVPSPPIATSGDPTPTMPSVSATPTHNVASSAGITQKTSLPMSYASSVHHQNMPNHLHTLGTAPIYDTMGGAGDPHHMVGGPRMVSMAHVQQQQQHSMRVAAAHGMRVNRMVVPQNQMQMGPGMGRHDMRMGPAMAHHQPVGPHHGMPQMQMQVPGGHQNMYQPHPHPVVGGAHPGMLHMMAGPGSGMPQQNPMGPIMSQQGMVNMAPSPGGASTHMPSHPNHQHMQMMQRGNPRPILTNPAVAGKEILYCSGYINVFFFSSFFSFFFFFFFIKN